MRTLFKKYNKIILSVFAFLLLSTLFYLVEGYVYSYVFRIERVIIYILIEAFVICNIIFDYKKIWDFIYKKRYIIAIVMFVIMVALGYNTSSIGEYTNHIQSNITSLEDQPFWGKTRAIRSDEFLVGTPSVLSQEMEGSFSSTNNRVMAIESSVLLFPKLTTLNISVLSSPQLIGFLFLDATRGFSFSTLLCFFLAFFGTFELLMLITKQKKLLSLFGTLILVFSPSVLWWNCQNYFSYGPICIVLFYKLITESKLSKKILFSILLGWMGSCFAALLYPAWQLPFGLLYLILVIWLIVDNKEKIYKKNFLYLILSIVIALILLLPAIFGSLDVIEKVANTVYPGGRNSIGGTGWNLLFQWLPSILFSYQSVNNPCETSQFICLYPIPLLLGIYQIIKNIKTKNNDLLLILLVVLGILLNIWNYIPIGVFAKISLLYMSTPERTQNVVGVICILIMIRWIDKYSTNSKVKLSKIILASIISFLTIVAAIYATEVTNPGYLTTIKTAVLSMLFFSLIIMLIINHKKLNKIFIFIMIAMALFSMATVNPLTRGISVLTEKPLAKEIQKIVEKDADAIWFSANTSLFMANYALANGARVINATNYYPNLKLWHKLDSSGKYDEVYNRYAHITIALTTDETKFKLMQADYFNLILNNNDVCKLDADYVISSDEKLVRFSSEKVNFKNIYGEDGAYIYKITCTA